MPKNQLTSELKKYLNINKGWLFKEDENLEIENINENNITEFIEIDLPYDWSIYKDFNQKSLSRNEGGLLDGGKAWYIKEINIDESFANKNIFIKFGGIYMDSHIYINGSLVGNYPFGYNTFSYDLTKHLKYGKNILAIKVLNEQPSSRWYSGSGIYRNVELVLREKIYIEENGIVIRTDDLKNNLTNPLTKIKLKLVNTSNFDEDIRIVYEVYNNEKLIKLFEEKEILKANQKKEIESSFTIDNPKLWDIENPNLYYLKVRAYLGENLVDEEIARYGYRFMDWTREDGFYLNGKYIKFHGVCLHHDNGALGSELFIDAERRKLQIMKDMGVNSIRTSHNPQSEEFIRLCDEMGILVQEEAFDTWHGNRKKEFDYNRFFNKISTHPDSRDDETWAEYDIKLMVKRDINSPSIIMWSIGNEIGETDHFHGIEQGIQLIKWIKEIDDTRFVTIGENKFKWNRNIGTPHSEVANYLDVVGLNYNEEGADELFERFPNWILYGAETSSAVRSRGVYYNPSNNDSIATGNANKPDRSYQMSDYGNDRVGWGATATDSWIFDRDRKYYAGQFIWTGFDYIGEPTPWHNEEDLGAPVTSSYFGIVDTAGLPKNDYYLYQSQWKKQSEKKVLHILPHWNFENKELLKSLGTDLKREDNIVPVRVYSNIQDVELFLNGNSLGKKSFNKKTTDYGMEYFEGDCERELYLEWLVPFEKGKLEAVGYGENGEVIAKDKVQTSEKESKIKLTSYNDEQFSDGLAYIRFDITDQMDNIVPTANNLVEFSCEGNAEIIGVDNGDASSQERYKIQKDGRWIRKAFSGSGIVILKLKEKGKAKLFAKSERLESANIEIEILEKKDNFEDLQKYSLLEGLINNGNGEILDYEKISIYLNNKDDVSKLKLPKKVRNLYSNRFSNFDAVNWNNEEIKNISGKGKYSIRGNSNDKEVLATIYVNDFVAVENFSCAKIKGSKNIDLPKEAFIYNTSGEVRKDKIVDWYIKGTNKKIDFEELKCEDNLLLEAKLEIKDFKPEMSIRFVEKDNDSIVYSYNYARAWNGSEIPAGIASYTNKDKNSADSTKFLNNEIVPFENQFLDRWTNISEKHRKNDWAGILFGQAGEFKQFVLNKLEVFFFPEDKDISMPKNYSIEYFLPKEISFPSDYQNINELDHELSKNENWVKIEKFSEKIGEHQYARVFEFEDISTHAIRVNMSAQDDKFLGVSEIKAFGKVVKEYEDFKLDIIIDGNKQEYIEDKVVYEIEQDAKEIVVKATNNASVIKIEGIEEKDDINYIIRSENKLKESKIILRRKNV